MRPGPPRSVMGRQEPGTHFLRLAIWAERYIQDVCLLLQRKMPQPPLKTQADRVAQSSAEGRKLFAFLQRPDILAKLLEAAERGTQPAAEISTELLQNFPSMLRDPVARRQTGFFVSALLDGEGYAVARANVRLRNPLFKSAAIYRKRPEPTTESGNLLSRLSNTLTKAEAQELVELLVDRFPGLKRRFR